MQLAAVTEPDTSHVAERRAREVVAIHAPTGRDGSLAMSILERFGVAAMMCGHMADMCRAIGDGVGVILLAEEALTETGRHELLGALATQPAWSDIPLIILTAEGELSRAITDGIEAVAARGNVMLLERPVRIATLVTAVRSALRARLRQYELRDYLAERDTLLQSERAARSEADEANRAKSQFLAVMSHELRTPLNAIAGYTELIDLGVHGSVTTQQREALRRIQQSERHLLGLIEGVLNYARVESGTVQYDVSTVLVFDLVAASEALVAPQMRAQGLHLAFSECDRELAILADGEKTQQIILNLLSNAMKFTPRGGHIAVTCADMGTVVAINVTDSGIGIAEDKLTRIFDPFVQVDTRLTRAHEGVGLGLAISRDLARGMGGDLTVSSVVGQGSTFTITLPAALRGER